MTREGIMSMKPGRELDVLIAKNVMGHEVFVEYTNYSTSIEAAWEIVDHINMQNMEVAFHANKNQVHFVIADLVGDVIAETHSKTAPHAICLAALLAVMEVD